MRRFALALLLVLSLPASAAGASRFYITGHGYGHGIGMSQYGAYGYAQHGWRYPAILAHYYARTSLGSASPDHAVRILLQSGPSAALSHLTRAGRRRLDARRGYVARNAGGRVQIGRLRFRSPVFVSGPVWSALGGAGYRGGFELRAVSGGIELIERTGVDAYIRGVVAEEMPPSWHPQALRAQAVAARSYALASSGVLYADTRSQAYGGMAAETPSTDAAVRATRGQVVTYRGRPVLTFFFSTSGGRTENVENSFIGSSPEPWLKSVVDRYDTISPVHSWRVTESLSAAADQLHGLFSGRLRGIRVLRRGASPRIVRALVLGTRASRVATGPELRSRLGMRDTWASFSTISAHRRARTNPGAGGGGSPVGGGGIGARTANLVRAGLWDVPPTVELEGAVLPAPRERRAEVQRWTGQGWVRAGKVTLTRRGAYDWPTPHRGRYRIVAGGLPGPAVEL